METECTINTEWGTSKPAFVSYKQNDQLESFHRWRPPYSQNASEQTKPKSTKKWLNTISDASKTMIWRAAGGRYGIIVSTRFTGRLGRQCVVIAD